MGETQLDTKPPSGVYNIPINVSQIQLWSPEKNKEKDLESEGSLEYVNGNSKEESRKNKEEEAEQKGWRRFMGMILTLVTSFLFSLASLIAKLLQAYDFNGNSSTFWRYLGVTLPAIPLLLFSDCNARRKTHTTVFDSIWPMNKDGKWKTVIGLVVRGMLGGMAVMFRYYALQYLSIADTAVITYSSPILVTILAYFLLGESLGLIPVLLTFTTLFGVILIAHPPIISGEESYDSETLIGVTLAIGSLICASLIVIITRKIRDVHFSVMTLAFGLIGVLQGFALTQYFNDFKYPDELYDSLLVLALAVFSFVGQMTIILATQFEQAGPVSLIRTCDVVFGFLLQFVFLGVIPTLFSALGGSVVLAGVVVTGLRKYIATLPVDNSTRRRMRYLLK